MTDQYIPSPIERAMMHLYLHEGDTRQCSGVAIAQALGYYPGRRANSILLYAQENGLLTSMRTKMICSTRPAKCLIYMLTDAGSSRAKRTIKLTELSGMDVRQAIRGVFNEE